MAYIPFLSDEKLFSIVKRVVDPAKKETEIRSENYIYRNALDPFSAVFDALIHDISLTEWIEHERMRQSQKTMQNKLGEFHQAILGNLDGWTDLKIGSLVDIVNVQRKIVAEIKNKHNTTKGSDKVVVYDSLKKVILDKYKGYTAYYVEIIPKNGKTYDQPFCPSDNKEQKKRIVNENIRQIDGKSFYDLATGYPESLRILYDALPIVLCDVLQKPVNIDKTNLFSELFLATYK